ncbi:alpha/beta hydrolase family protein [Chitinophaga pinensis]|uniref:Peptidase S9 prolyl oligopeptidase active site domain protein n=1 Tax=Chitinophaga pinensis (strain ATCC 43595 / DSM 2588 / LMG 13176 / NBRC 15968 / NCIMB 11800 / UQM 2034) TaxID=485918 RepID=A0A979GQH4_CHIPD|nr:prolyl oligopeptidase family serine peptidase [Chitinophaga pinensis]ACU57636.1 peptidase S9 prolyl oligopeptidase active site domain protein [Chitinophaga pinensis DSM 2588]
MRRILPLTTVFVIILLLLEGIEVVAQSKVINESTYQSWPILGSSAINGNGRYVSYFVKNYFSPESNLHISSSDGKKRIQINNCHWAEFISGNRIVFLQNDQNLSFVDLKEFKLIKKISRVGDMKIIGNTLNKFLLYRLQGSDSICLFSLLDGRVTWFGGIDSYDVSKDEKFLLLKTKSQLSREGSEITYFNVNSKNEKKIRIAGNVISMAIQSDDKGMAFVSEEFAGYGRKLWFYNVAQDHLQLLLDSVATKNFFSYECSISGNSITFSDIGDKIFFNIDRKGSSKQERRSGEVIVWSYKDKILESQKIWLGYGLEKESIYCVFNLKTKTFLKLDESADIINVKGMFNRYAVVLPNKATLWFQNIESPDSLFIIDTDSAYGSKEYLPASIYSDPILSPDERFVVWFDKKTLKYYSYDIRNHKIHNIDKSIPTLLYDQDAAKIRRIGTWGIAGWIPEEKSILVYDQFDIWKLSLEDSQSAVNITEGEGRKNRITLTIKGRNYLDTFSRKQNLIIIGYNRENKDGGYWKLQLGKKFRLAPDHLNPFSVSSRTPYGIYYSASGDVISARNADMHIVVRESAAESSNIYITSDFKSYTKLSNVNPEKEYKWMTSELVEWKAFDGRICQGLLYRPSDFDSTKRYPLILNYYEKRSDELHKFIIPDYSKDNLNIPSFVDAGFLIFVPDIYSTPGFNGEGTYNCIESATKFLSTFSYVDSNKIALQGHSYGGWQTNYMVTHSNRYAAACEAAGVADQISGYGQLAYNFGGDRQMFYELNSQGSPYGLGITPWTKPDLYIKNSPIFNVGNIVTPLLMMHNRDDEAVPFSQAVEFFLALRRASKKVWLLQYVGEYSHQVTGPAAKDYHTKMLQFFEHYLKGESCPSWMQ